MLRVVRGVVSVVLVGVACKYPGLPELSVPSDAFVVTDAATDAPVDAYDDIGTGSCNVLTQTGCAPGEKCGWFSSGSGLGYVSCAPNGDVAVGSLCTIGSGGSAAVGYSNCARGTECKAQEGPCEQICGVDGTPQCPNLYGCGTYVDLFDQAGNITAGVCDPECDVFTQEVLDGNIAACGSPVPENPYLGCYLGGAGSAGYQFATCSSTPESRGVTAPATDRVPCTAANGCATLNNAPYSNGCAPGYDALLIQNTGSTTVICSALCSPLETDKTQAANAPGNTTALGKLPGDSVPVAGHADCKSPRAGAVTEDCYFFWYLNEQFNASGSASVGGSPLNDVLGVCIAPASYQYTGLFGTSPTDTTPIPDCATLLSGSAGSPAVVAATTPGACNTTSPNTSMASCYAANWGCYKLEHSNINPPGPPHVFHLETKHGETKRRRLVR
jgi:hypothetical protein